RVAIMVFLAILVVFGLVFLNVHRTTMADVTLSPDGQTLAVSSSGHDTSIDATVLLWNLAQPQRVTLQQSSVGRLAWSADSQLLAVEGNPNTNSSPDPGRVCIWEMKRKRL